MFDVALATANSLRMRRPNFFPRSRTRMAGETVLAHENWMRHHRRRLRIETPTVSQVLTETDKSTLHEEGIGLPENVTLPTSTDGAHPGCRLVWGGWRKSNPGYRNAFLVVAFGAGRSEILVRNHRRRSVVASSQGALGCRGLGRTGMIRHPCVDRFRCASYSDAEGKPAKGEPHTFSTLTAHFL